MTSSQPGFPHWSPGHKVKRDYKKCLTCSEHFDDMFPVCPPQVPADWPAESCLSVACFPLRDCIWFEDKPLRGVFEALVLVDLAVGNCWLNHFLCINSWSRFHVCSQQEHRPESQLKRSWQTRLEAFLTDSRHWHPAYKAFHVVSHSLFKWCFCSIGIRWLMVRFQGRKTGKCFLEDCRVESFEFWIYCSIKSSQRPLHALHM